MRYITVLTKWVVRYIDTLSLYRFIWKVREVSTMSVAVNVRLGLSFLKVYLCLYRVILEYDLL